MRWCQARATCAGLLLFTAALCGTASSLGAQNGTSVFVAGVADAETGQPLENAEVVFLGLRRLARANAMGEAQLAGVPHGTHRLRVRMLGYAPADVQLTFAGDTTGAVFRLTRTPATLTPVNVEAEAVSMGLRDAERRRQRGIGRFLSFAVLDKERDKDLGLLVSMRFPGLRLVTGTGGGQQLMSTRGTNNCPVHVYIDDASLGVDQDLWFIRTWDLALVEYYTPSQVPPQYRSRPHQCGVLLLWSKWF